MEIFGLNGWEPLVLIIVFLVVIGPQRLPEYTRNVIQGVRRARRWVEESRATVENEMGMSMDELRKYDPRQYDPRRIIRDAWGDTSLDDIMPDTKSLVSAATVGGAAAAGSAAGSSRSDRSVSRADASDAGDGRAPFDPEAT
ncbi:translocase [Brachybacterium sp. JHP9]|uniref:Translocase n=1 Tax=Brachybacterium equifaecis TaxID=2910770 RepID=A0ABT0QWL3_9MICO|nr:translocase [Brachybacterium equifaecis]